MTVDRAIGLLLAVIGILSLCLVFLAQYVALGCGL